MTWDLVSLKSHPHRAGDEDVMVLIAKTVRRSEREGVQAVQYQVEVCPLPLVVSQGNEKRLVPVEKAQFRVTADIVERKVMFDIGGADAALPSVVRGGGLGSLAISELVNWCKKQFADFTVVNGHISAGILNFPNAEPNAIRCLKNFGFAVSRAASGGLQFEAAGVARLTPHLNTAKVQNADPIRWTSGLVEDNIRLAAQLQDQSRDIAGLKEQLHQVTQSRQSPAPFIGGILAGCVAGTAITALLFSL